jgi:heme oxygenase
MKKQLINEVKRMQHLAGIITENEYQESISEGNSFYQDMITANPGWDEETVMNMVKDEYDEETPGDFEDHQEYLEDSKEWFNKVQSAGPTVKVGDKVEVLDKMTNKFIPGTITKALILKGSFMYSGNVEPDNIPGCEISDESGRKTVYPQYQEGEGFRKI